jgi:anaerobic magnesium-protoporphyrin IX monomethyl ester cyclase
VKVLFVYTREVPQSPVKPLVDLEAIQFGISSISAYLKRAGHRTRLLVLTRADDFSTVDRLVGEFEPQLVCLTAVASEYAFVEKIGAYLKERYPGLFLMAGGVHVSLRPDDAMLEVFDACCIGEGEEATLELVGQLEQGIPPRGIPNLWIRHQGGIEKNPPRSFLPELDALPYPDREMWLEWLDLERCTPRPSLLLGRGCPFLCSYCCNHSLKKVASGRYVRFRSPENVVGEIEQLTRLFPEMQEIYFEVETLGAHADWGL